VSRDSQALGLPARRIPAIERQIARCFDAPRHVPV
jgi:hypothetical protein